MDGLIETDGKGTGDKMTYSKGRMPTLKKASLCPFTILAKIFISLKVTKSVNPLDEP